MNEPQGTAATAVLYETDKLRLTDAQMDRAAGTIDFHLYGTESHTAPLQAALEKQFGQSGQVEFQEKPQRGWGGKHKEFNLLYHAPGGMGDKERIMQDAPRMQAALDEAGMTKGAPDMVKDVFTAFTNEAAQVRDVWRDFGNRERQ